MKRNNSSWVNIEEEKTQNENSALDKVQVKEVDIEVKGSVSTFIEVSKDIINTENTLTQSKQEKQQSVSSTSNMSLGNFFEENDDLNLDQEIANQLKRINTDDNLAELIERNEELASPEANKSLKP